MSKSKEKIRVSFVGTNNTDVTGSCIHIQMKDCQILLECGLFQGHNNYDDYKINNRRFDFKPKEIEYIFVNHVHIDHVGLLPKLYAQGCKARIIAPKGTSQLFRVMGADSAFIMSRDVELFKKKYNKVFTPIYKQEDVDNCLQYFEEYDYNEKIKLSDNIEFSFQPSGHIICSAQLELWLTQNNRTSKILYTSDLGNIQIPKHYIEEFIPIQKANLVIGESTYSDKQRVALLKDRDKDLEKIKSVIDTTCIDNNSKVLIAVFALDRLQNMVTHLYELYGNDETFDIPVLIDTPLGSKICGIYQNILKGEQLKQFNKVMAWDNIIHVKDYEDSKFYMQNDNACISISCSGMLQAGRARNWVAKLLPKSRNHILFCGYSPPTSLAGKIKSGKQKSITIDGKAIANRCNITDLKSFSSHMQRDELLNYYSNINCEKVALVHSEYKAKCEFGKELQDEISKKNKTSKVIIINKDTSILL